MSQLHYRPRGGIGHREDVIRDQYYLGLEKQKPVTLKESYNRLVQEYIGRSDISASLDNFFRIREVLFEKDSSIKEMKHSLEDLAGYFVILHSCMNFKELEEFKEDLGFDF